MYITDYSLVETAVFDLRLLGVGQLAVVLQIHLLPLIVGHHEAHQLIWTLV